MDSRGQVFERCFRERYPEVVQFLHGMLGERATAEDVAQETFLRLWDRGPSTRPDADRWLFRVARNLALDLLKRADRRRSRETRYAADEPHRTQPDSEDVLRVRALVRSLPERAREVLLLREFTGLSYDEIARVVGRSTNVVKQDLHRARRALRRAWFAEQEVP